MFGSVCFLRGHRDVTVLHDDDEPAALALASEMWGEEASRSEDRTCGVRYVDCDFSPFSQEYNIIRSDGFVRFVESDV